MQRSSDLIALLLLLLVCGVSMHAQQNWSPEHVYYGRGGNLTYTPDDQGNTIPDFSHVGYRHGDEPIPHIPVRVEVFPMDGDDGAAIQSAINQVAALAPDSTGFRGAVLLKAGTYQVAGQILIQQSGIVLRGEGNSDSGTVIYATGTGQRELIKVDNGSSRDEDLSANVAINESYVPVGRKYVVVSDASPFSINDDILLYRPGTQQWISDLKMDQITPSEGTVQWTPSSYTFRFERKITLISGDTLFFRNPVVMAMETKYGGGRVFAYSFDRLENVGIENLSLKSVYSSNTDENHSWSAILFKSAENSWVREVTSWYFAYACVNLGRDSKLITVENCHCREPKSMITGGRRYSFNVAGSLHLIYNCSTTEGRHDFVTSSRVCGPNVFSRCSAAKAHSDIGPHHRWAMGTLFDVIETDGAINVQDRDDMGTGHGWAGANQVFWNCNGASSICQSPWVSAKNYNVGFMGEKRAGARPGRPDGEWIGHNRAGLFPVSLYEAQLEHRLTANKLFSAIPVLEQLNDSTFRMSFTLPLDSTLVIPENFVIGGTAGLEDHPVRIEQADDFSVNFTFGEMGVLTTHATITVNASSLVSREGLAMEGVVQAVFTEPDRRPVVYGLEVWVNNEEGFAEASSSKTGYIYIIKFGNYPKSVAEFDTLVNHNLGRREEVVQADLPVQISTRGLPAGAYRYYAIDEEGRISEPGNTWVHVEEYDPVSVNEPAPFTGSFTAFSANGLIRVVPGDDTPYSLAIYSITGSLLYQARKLTGKHFLDPGGYEGLLIIRKRSELESAVVRMFHTQ